MQSSFPSTGGASQVRRSEGELLSRRPGKEIFELAQLEKAIAAGRGNKKKKQFAKRV